MARIEHFKRRCGNTTRQVDEWIQQLFNGGEVVVQDHAHKNGGHAHQNEYAKRILLNRLNFEHNLKPGENSQLQVDGDKFTLLPF